MDKEEIKKHPTEVLSQDIFKFTQDIECLHTTLPLLMTIMGAVKKKTHDEFRGFINKHALDKIENGDETTYTLKIEDTAKHNRY